MDFLNFFVEFIIVVTDQTRATVDRNQLYNALHDMFNIVFQIIEGVLADSTYVWAYPF